MIKIFEVSYLKLCVRDLQEIFDLDFDLIDYYKFNNFYTLKMEIPIKLSYEELLENVDKIRTIFIYPIMLSRDNVRFNIFYIHVNFNVEQYVEFDYYKSDYVLVGFDFKGYPIFLDLEKSPHLMISGDSGSGKTFLLRFILNNLMLNKKRIFLYQARKDDLNIYSDSLDVCLTLQDIYLSLNNVYNILKFREHCKDKSYKDIYLIFEEFSSLCVKSSDSKNTKELKNKILDILTDVALMGRTLRIYLIITVQKGTTDMIPSAIKNQLKNRIALKIEDNASSTTIIGNGNACNINRGFGILKNEIEEIFIVPLIR